ncbi:MAG: hypothetical protein HQ559_08875, partial [Lentisphaerae bacterium]|nr:hypothetical protein [Lentisphaerota bacterium]
LKQTYDLTRLSPDKMTGTAQNFGATWSWDTGEIYELDTSAKWRHPAVWERTPVEAPRSDP